MTEEMLTNAVITILSALAAAASFVAFTLPLLNRDEKKERYQSIIEKRRKDLYRETREGKSNKGSEERTLSARESLAMSFKVEEMLGGMGEKARDLMLQAGIRDPRAPVKFIAARIAIPVFLMTMAMMIISGADKELSNGIIMLILLAAVFVGYKLPGVLIKNQIQKRVEEINLSFPDALDMMLICVQGGIGLEQAVARISEEIAEHSPTLAEELGILSAEMAMLNDRKTALQDFGRRIGSGAAKTFATSLIQAEQYGTSVSKAMRVLADELRDMRMAAAEQKAAALPPKLTVPMIAFFLPVLFVVILGPAVLQAMETL